jgi:hypothetical protein
LATSNPVVSLHVYTINKYDNEHPSGSEITDRFGSPTYPKGIGPLDLPLNVLQYEGGPPYNAFELYMTKRPDPGTEQQFRVVTTLLDSTKFTGITPVLQF